MPSLRLFGTPSLQSVPLTSRKQQRLFAYLAIHHRPVTREAVAALFWPNSADCNKNLRNLLWQIGQHGEWISADETHITLHPDVWCDVRALQSWQPIDDLPTATDALLTLYCGQLLADIPSSLDYIWLENARLQLKQRFLDHCYALAWRAAKQNSWQIAYQLAKRGSDVAPEDDRFQQMLFAAAHNTGDRERVWDMLRPHTSLSENITRMARRSSIADTISADCLPIVQKSPILTPKRMTNEPFLSLTLLGAFAAERGNQLEIRSPKQISLLAYLALNELPVERNQLARLLWANSSQTASTKNLRNMLWKLRKLADGELFDVQDGRFRLLSNTQNDVSRFEEAARSIVQRQSIDQEADLLARYHGSLLSGWRAANMADFEHWLVVERQRLDRMAVNAFEMLVRIYTLSADWGHTLQVATRTLMVDDFNEAVYRSMMVAYVQQEQPNRALALYNQLCERLADQLAVSPEDRTIQLYRSILAGQQPVATDIWQPLPVRVQATRLTPQVAETRPLYERISLSDRIMQGVPQTFLIEGSFGTGKTRLLHATPNIMTGQTIDVRAAQLATPLPLQPLIDALNQLKELDELDSIWCMALSRWLPQLAENDDIPLFANSFEPIAQAFAHVAQKAPLMLRIDDLDRADTDTKRALTYLVERWQQLDAPLTLVVAQSADAPNRWQPDDPLINHITLKPLSVETVAIAVKQLAQTDSPTTAVQRVQKLFAATAGNPYLLNATLNHDIDSPFMSVEAHVQVVLPKLSSEAAAWLKATAIFGEDATFEHVKQALGIDELPALKALSDALESDFLVVDQQHKRLSERIYLFKHNAVRKALLESLAPTLRRQLHRRAYEIGLAAALPSETLAHHAHHAALPAQAFDQLLSAIETAREKLATEHAKQLLATAQGSAQMADAISWISAEQEQQLRDLTESTE